MTEPQTMDLTSVVQVETLGRKFLSVDPAQFPFGDYEFRDELDVKSAYWNDLTPSDVVIDIGASWGGYTLPALAQGALCVAIEPSPRSIEVLRENVRINRWEDRCIISQAILGDGGALGDWYRADMLKHFGVPVEGCSMRLDDLVRDLGLPRVTRIKSDIEGAEVDMLRGATETLRRWRPLLVIEDHTSAVHPGMGRVREQCAEIARECGYEEIRFWQPERGNPFIIAGAT